MGDGGSEPCQQISDGALPGVDGILNQDGQREGEGQIKPGESEQRNLIAPLLTEPVESAVFGDDDFAEDAQNLQSEIEGESGYPQAHGGDAYDSKFGDKEQKPVPFGKDHP